MSPNFLRNEQRENLHRFYSNPGDFHGFSQLSSQGFFFRQSITTIQCLIPGNANIYPSIWSKSIPKNTFPKKRKSTSSTHRKTYEPTNETHAKNTSAQPFQILNKAIESEDIAGQLVISMSSQDPPDFVVAVPLNQFLTAVMIIHQQPQGFQGFLQNLGIRGWVKTLWFSSSFDGDFSWFSIDLAAMNIHQSQQFYAMLLFSTGLFDRFWHQKLDDLDGKPQVSSTSTCRWKSGCRPICRHPLQRHDHHPSVLRSGCAAAAIHRSSQRPSWPRCYGCLWAP